MKLFGDKREYFSSLFAMICSVLWSFVFFSLFEILFKEWLLPAVIDFFPSSHVYLKAELGADYAYILRVYYFSYVNSFFSLLLGVKFGFKGSKKRKAHFRGFTDGIVSLKDAFAHHYKSYGILDVLSAFVVTGFFYALKKNGVADFIGIIPHTLAFEILLPSSASKDVFCFLLSSLFLSFCSLYGVYSSQKTWCADILYDLE